MSLTEGLYANMSIGGSAVGLLAEVDFECSADMKEWANMGSTTCSDVLQGVKKYKGNAKKGYTDEKIFPVTKQAIDDYFKRHALKFLKLESRC